MAFLCFATLGSVLSRTTLPGGYSVGQELHYIGSLRYTDAASAISSMSGITMKPPLTMGMKGIVVGPPGEPSLVGSALSLKFAMLFDEVVDVPLQDLSLEPPPPPDLEKLKFYGILFISLFVGLLGAFWIWILYFDEPPAEAAKEPPPWSSSSRRMKSSLAVRKACASAARRGLRVPTLRDSERADRAVWRESFVNFHTRMLTHRHLTLQAGRSTH